MADNPQALLAVSLGLILCCVTVIILVRVVRMIEIQSESLLNYIYNPF